MLTARFISSQETYPIRLGVLWPHLSKLEECALDIDELPTTFHVGVENESKQITTIATFLQETNKKFNEENQYRLRAMATDNSQKEKGAGRLAIEFALNHLKSINIELLWCDAREVALGFYEKLGFSIIGDFYNVRNIGPHKLMYKRIN